jgi:hypothetical protein
MKPQTENQPYTLRGNHTRYNERAVFYNYSLEPDLVYIPLQCSVRLLIIVLATLLQYNYVIHY